MSRSPEAAAQAMIDNLKAKTGKTLSEWFSALDGKGFEKHGEFMKHLKGEMGISHGYANLIAQKYREDTQGGPAADPVAAQYAAAKSHLKPIYDKIVSTVQAFGPDVEIAPKKTYVSLRANKQFALVQPSTRDRVDLGINLGDTKPGGRLEASGSFNSMVTHRVRLASVEDVDGSVKKWLEHAYSDARA